MAGTVACRKAFTEELLSLAKEDASIYAVTTDASGSVTLGDFAKELPGQFVEMGIAEQNAVACGAGLSLTGLNVFVCGPACFLSARSFEQVKVDVAYNHTNVKLIGVSGGLSYGPLGTTHTTLHDIAQMRALPGLTVLLPADAAQTRALTKDLVRFEGPAYVRMGRGAVPDVYAPDETFEIGKAKHLYEGDELTVIACGETVYHAKQAVERLRAEGRSVALLDLFTLKPLDEQAILDAARKTGKLLTVEEHIVNGGLGAAAAQLLAEHNPVPMRILGLPDEEIVAGESTELFPRYGIDSNGIYEAAKKLLNA